MKKFVIALSIAAISVAAYAGPHRGAGRHRGAHFAKIAEKLNLSDAQKQQIREMRAAERQKNQQLYADLRAKVRQFRELKKANDPKADSLKAEIRPLREQARAARKAAREQFLSVLTPEQRQQLEQWRGR